MDDLLSNIVWNLAVPAVLLFGFYKFSIAAFNFIMTLRVEGKANEWVLILNNGKLKQAGIGLHTWKGIFDTVATFPSNVNKVDFSAETITSDWLGVRVSGTVIWTINRNGDGPFIAYKALGSDLKSSNPFTANGNLEAKAASIVRTEIANSSIKEILRNREKIRLRIRSEMKDVEGWGIWIETVEVTEVLISSSDLFSNMQSEFRQLQSYNALCKLLDVNNAIWNLTEDFKQKTEGAK